MILRPLQHIFGGGGGQDPQFSRIYRPLTLASHGSGCIEPVSDRRRHAELGEPQLDDLVGAGDDAVQDAADAGRVDARVVG